MRTLEITLLLLSAILPILSAQLLFKLPLKSRRIAIAGFISILLTHLVFEGYRWQMIPIYFLSFFFVITAIQNKSFFGTSRFKKIVTSLILGFSLILGSVLSIGLPIFELPQPTGKYAVGALHYHLKTGAPEIISPEPSDNRELMLKIWYPAALNNEPTEPYLTKAERVGFARKYGIPDAALNYLDCIETNTYVNPNTAKGKFPVLIFSPGIYTNATGYYALLEELTSRGFIVVNINPTYESTGSSFPDGSMLFYNQEFDRKHNTKAMSKLAWGSTQDYLKAKTKKEEFAAVEELLRNYVANIITLRWAKDISLVIDHLYNLKTEIPLAQHMNLTKIGVFGHSQGGAAAGEALIYDSRIKAGLNLDGVQWGNVLDTSFSKPFAYLSSDWPEDHPNLNEHIYQRGNSTDFYEGKILHSGHASFMDIPLMINIPVINESGSIAPTLAHKISSTFVLQFFEKYLQDEPHQILELEDKFENLNLKMNTIKTKR